VTGHKVITIDAEVSRCGHSVSQSLEHRFQRFAPNLVILLVAMHMSPHLQ